MIGSPDGDGGSGVGWLGIGSDGHGIAFLIG
jgi:hypothetical protein